MLLLLQLLPMLAPLLLRLLLEFSRAPLVGDSKLTPFVSSLMHFP